MAKKPVVKLQGAQQAKNNLLKFINESIKDPKFLEEIGQETVDQIRNRTRGRLEEYKQDPITDYSKKRRKSLIPKNAFDTSIVSANRSNLSLSGQLLSAITYKVNQAQAAITIFLKPSRKPYKGSKKAELENKKDNNEIKKDLESRGREFLFVSDKLNILLESKIAQSIRRKLSLYNKLRRKLSLK